MKVVWKAEATGHGLKRFISIVPETLGEAHLLGKRFPVDRDLGTIVYKGNRHGLCGNVDPEQLANYINDHVFLGLMDEEQIARIRDTLVECFQPE